MHRDVNRDVDRLHKSKKNLDGSCRRGLKDPLLLLGREGRVQRQDRHALRQRRPFQQRNDLCVEINKQIMIIIIVIVELKRRRPFQQRNDLCVEIHKQIMIIIIVIVSSKRRQPFQQRIDLCVEINKQIMIIIIVIISSKRRQPFQQRNDMCVEIKKNYDHHNCYD